MTATTGLAEGRAPTSGPARAVFRDLLRFGSRARVDLAERTELSLPSITRATKELLVSGLVHELPVLPHSGGKGRPQLPLDVDESAAPRFIGLKITEDSLYAAATTVRGNELEEIFSPLEDTSPDMVIAEIVELVEQLRSAHQDVAGLGIGLGGRVRNRREVLDATMIGWHEPVDLGSRLESLLGIPVSVENDFLCLLHRLHWFGIGQRYGSFVVATVGAGVALGMVHDGRVVEGHRGFAGRTERHPVSALSGPGLFPLGDITRTSAVLRRARGRGVLEDGEGLAELIRRAEAGDEGALQVARESARAMAEAAGSAVCLLDPDAVLIGGEGAPLLAAAGPVFQEVLAASLSDVQSDLVVRHLESDFDEWALGAAAIAVQRFVGIG